MNKVYLNALVLCISVFMQQHAQAWPTPVDINADLTGDGSTAHFLNNTTTPSTTMQYYRCDTPSSEFSDFLPVPDVCHRWGLLFEKSGEVGLSSWNPSVDDVNNDDTEAGYAKYRLPTIKELVRLYDYSSGSLDYVITDWLPVTDTTWLISSSYRDIDINYSGGDDSQYAQVFALNASTGEVKALQPNDLSICTALWSGVFNSVNRGRCSSTTGHSVYAIKVQQNPIGDM